MRRLLATIRCDAVFQLRNGFYAATAFVTVIWVLILIQAGALNMQWLLPPLVLGNLAIGTFSFIGGLVLLERGAGTLAAQAVTPLRLAEYLAAKVATLAALGLAETLVIVPLLAGWRFSLTLLVLGALLGALIYCLAGFIVVVRYTAVNEYLLPSGLAMAALWLPLLAYTAQWQHWLLYLHPLSAPLALLQAAFAPAAPWQVVYGLAAALGWAALLGIGCGRAYRRWVRE